MRELTFVPVLANSVFFEGTTQLGFVARRVQCQHSLQGGVFYGVCAAATAATTGAPTSEAGVAATSTVVVGLGDAPLEFPN